MLRCVDKNIGLSQFEIEMRIMRLPSPMCHLRLMSLRMRLKKLASFPQFSNETQNKSQNKTKIRCIRSADYFCVIANNSQ